MIICCHRYPYQSRKSEIILILKIKDENHVLFVVEPQYLPWSLAYSIYVPTQLCVKHFCFPTFFLAKDILPLFRYQGTEGVPSHVRQITVGLNYCNNSIPFWNAWPNSDHGVPFRMMRQKRKCAEVFWGGTSTQIRCDMVETPLLSFLSLLREFTQEKLEKPCGRQKASPTDFLPT